MRATLELQAVPLLVPSAHHGARARLELMPSVRTGSGEGHAMHRSATTSVSPLLRGNLRVFPGVAASTTVLSDAGSATCVELASPSQVATAPADCVEVADAASGELAGSALAAPLAVLTGVITGCDNKGAAARPSAAEPISPGGASAAGRHAGGAALGTGSGRAGLPALPTRGTFAAFAP